MDQDNILEETAYEEMAALEADDFDDDDYDSPESDDYDYEDEDVFAYRADRQSEYDDEWGDPLDVPSYGY